MKIKMAFFVTIGTVILSLSIHVRAQSSLQPSANCTGAGEDLPGWREMASGDNCQAYTDDTTLCTEYGNYGGDSPFEDISANEACIACGACDTCNDLPNFADEAGLTCTDYADDAAFDEQYPDGYYPVESWYGYYPDESWCLIFGIDANADNITAQASCCVCGGGIRSPFVPGTTNAPTFATTLPGAISSAPTFHNGG